MSKRLAQITTVGLKHSLFGALECTRNFRLQRRYGFDDWHVNSPFHWKPYKQIVVDTASGLEPSTVVEIGCGLGDIVSRVKADQRLGLDRDHKVIRACRILHSNRFEVCGDLRQAAAVITSQAISYVDVLIMVNWPHNVPPEELISSLEDMTQKIFVRFLIIDLVRPGISDHRFCHSEISLSKLGVVELSVPLIDSVRDLAVLRLEARG